MTTSTDGTLGPDFEEPEVVVVDLEDRELGTERKTAAHRSPGVLHRAVSVFVFDGDRRLLLQRRAGSKYHFAGLWSNTCCTHPEPGESPVEAGERRLAEELGFTCRLESVGSFVYRAEDDGSGLVEHEFDHVLRGTYDGEVAPEPAEVDDVRSVTVDDLQREMLERPAEFTPWLTAALGVLLDARVHDPGTVGVAAAPAEASSITGERA